MAKNEQRETEILENGDIFFLYRPRVEEEEPSGMGDVQRFHVVLRPAGQKRLRLLTVGRKRLPAVESHERNWGFVETVTDSPIPSRNTASISIRRTRTTSTPTRSVGCGWSSRAIRSSPCSRANGSSRDGGGPCRRRAQPSAGVWRLGSKRRKAPASSQTSTATSAIRTSQAAAPMSSHWGPSVP